MFVSFPWLKGLPGNRMGWNWHSSARRIFVAILALVLAACSTKGPAPIDYRGKGYSAGRSTAYSSTVVVRKGDTVYAIGRRYGVSSRAIISANNLRPPFTLQIGQRLKLPVPQFHTVGRGDTLYGVSRRYGVGMNSLARANGLRSPYRLQVGQKLTIPNGGRQVAQAPARSTPAVRPSARQSNSAARPTPLPKPNKPLAAPPPRASSGFLWPIKGRLISGFGPKAGGLHNDGVNIAAASGTEVKAAQNGIVAYAGTAIEGYGRLILIKHSDGWTSAYAHNRSLMVARGDKVERGQVIAKVGDTGDVNTPQLHFELRKGKRAVDPIKLMGRP